MLNVNWWNEESAKFNFNLCGKTFSEEILDNELKILSVKDDVAALVNALDAQVESIENGKISINSFNDSQVIIFRNDLKEIKELATSKKNVYNLQ